MSVVEVKDIELPITQSFSVTIDTHNIDMSKVVDMGDGVIGVSLGNVVDNDISAITEKARLNGGKVLYATTSIEQQMESILLRYFMGDFVAASERRVLFEKEILQSSALSYSAKKHLILKVINAHSLLNGKSKNNLQYFLKKIMGWRNSFAHGKVQYDNVRGCFIKYYSGESKQLSLTDEFWCEVENTFKDCSELLNKALQEVEKA